jgi:hypothetical protein
VRHVLRVREPIVDLRGLSVPLALTLEAVALASGSVQSLLQLQSLVGCRPSSGWATASAVAMLYSRCSRCPRSGS